MARYLLDTNILSYLADRASPFHDAVHAQLSTIPDADEVALSVLSLYELYHWFAYQPEPRQAADAILRPFTLAPVPETGAERFGALTRDLRRTFPRADLQRHAVDCMIAVTALEHGAVLVSNDALFKRLADLVPALQVADWTLP